MRGLPSPGLLGSSEEDDLGPPGPGAGLFQVAPGVISDWVGVVLACGSPPRHVLVGSSCPFQAGPPASQPRGPGPPCWSRLKGALILWLHFTASRAGRSQQSSGPGRRVLPSPADRPWTSDLVGSLFCRTGNRAVTPGLRTMTTRGPGPAAGRKCQGRDRGTPDRRWSWAAPSPQRPPCPPAASICLKPGRRGGLLRTHLAKHSRPWHGGVMAQECRKAVWGSGTEAWQCTKNVPCRKIIMRLGNMRNKPGRCHRFCLFY